MICSFCPASRGLYQKLLKGPAALKARAVIHTLIVFAFRVQAGFKPQSLTSAIMAWWWNTTQARPAWLYIIYSLLSQGYEYTPCYDQRVWAGLAWWWLRRSFGKRKDAGSTPRFGSPFFKKKWFMYMHCLVILPCTINDTLQWLTSTSLVHLNNAEIILVVTV